MHTDNMAGMGQFVPQSHDDRRFATDQFAWTQQYNMTNRKNVTMQPQPKAKKPGFFGEEEEGGEPSIFFNNPALFRQDKEMMSSPTPQSQMNSFAAPNFYGQTAAGMGNLNIPQRGMTNAGMSNAPYQRNSTPTSMNAPGPNFPLGLQQPPPTQQQPGPPPQQASPNRNLFAMNQRGILRPNALSASLVSSTSATPSSMSNFTNAFSAFARPDGSQPSMDMSEFPSLSNRGSTFNPIPAARSYVGMVQKPPSDPTPEFQIQQEDFPALPGSQNPPTSNSNDNSMKTSALGSVAGVFDQAGNKDGAKFTGDKSATNQQRRGIQTHPDGTVTNVPLSMVTDQFGMVGLLTFIRAAENDSNIVALAQGVDLTTLGLNLNAPDHLYSTFQSPWADSPCRPQDIDFHVPSEYITNIYIRDKLAPIKLNRYGDDLLFYLFYMNGGDVLQLAAAAELYNRDWRYHKEDRVWITRAPGYEPAMKTNTYENGTYFFFDAQNWRKVAKEFHLEYDKLEERPHLPTSFTSNPNMNNPVPVMAE